MGDAADLWDDQGIAGLEETGGYERKRGKPKDAFASFVAWRLERHGPNAPPTERFAMTKTDTIKPGNYIRVWSEDDATVGQEGHETLREAFKRLFGLPWKQSLAVQKLDHGDEEEHLLANGVWVLASYPGNNEIWVDKTQTQTTQDGLTVVYCATVKAAELVNETQASAGTQAGSFPAARNGECETTSEETTVTTTEQNNNTFTDDLDDEILSGVSADPPRVLIHGPEKIGKTSWAAGAPKPIFIQTEDGLGQIGAKRFPLCKDWRVFVDCVDKVRNSKHSYETLAIDSLDWLEKLIHAEVCRESNVKSIELAAGGYGKGYGRASEMLYWLLTERLDAIRLQRGMGIILIAHSKVEKAEEPGLPAYDRASPRLDKRAAPIVCEWVDAIGWATKRVRVEADKTVKADQKGYGGRHIPHAIGNNEHILVVSGGKPQCVAGNRYGITEDLPLSWQAFADAAFAPK